MTRISAKKARELGPQPAPAKNKYHNTKTIIDGIKFDSKRESDYYCELKLRKRANEILDFELQPSFTLQDGFVYQGKKIRPIKYIADFRVIHKDFSVEIIDVKSSKTFQTKEYRLKKKMLLYKYPNIVFKEVY